MRWSVLASAIGLTLLTLSSPGHAKKEPVVLEPASKWNVDFAPTKCRLGRTFGEGENLHVLIIEQFYPATNAGLSVAGPSFRRFRNMQETILTFSDDMEPRTTEPFKGDMGNYGPALVYSSVAFNDRPFLRIELEEMRKKSAEEQAAITRPAGREVQSTAQLDTEFGARMDFISFTQKGREVRFNTGSLGQAFEVLNTCTKDMIREWGFDIEEQLAITKRPVWVNELAIAKRIQKTYPSRALRRGESAILRMRVTVDEQGKVTDCVLNEATETRALESPACREMTEAEFEPALDRNGEPVRSFYTTGITYRIN